ELAAMRARFVVVTLDEGDAAADFLLEVPHGPGQRRAHEVLEALVVEVARAEVAGKQDRSQVVEHAGHDVPRREHEAPSGRLSEVARPAAQRLDNRGKGDQVDRRWLLRAHVRSSKSHVERYRSPLS